MHNIIMTINFICHFCMSIYCMDTLIHIHVHLYIYIECAFLSYYPICVLEKTQSPKIIFCFHHIVNSSAFDSSIRSYIKIYFWISIKTCKITIECHFPYLLLEHYCLFTHNKYISPVVAIIPYV